VVDSFGRSLPPREEGLTPRPALILTFLFWVSAPRASAAQPTTEPSEATARSFFESERWQELLLEFPSSNSYSAKLDFYRGMALARLERWQEARDALELGAAKSPGDSRFPLELAGIFFKMKDFRQAKSALSRSLSLGLEADDEAYANDFLGTLFYLEGNLDATLEYWNRVEKPFIRRIEILGELRLDPELLDRAVSASRESVLTLEELRTSRATLQELGVFARTRFELKPGLGSFDLHLMLTERNGFGKPTLGSLASLLRGVPFETVYLDFFNLGGSAHNSRSFFRWDANKRRIFTSFSGPIASDPSRRFRLFLDARREEWDVAGSALAHSGPSSQFGLETFGGGWEVVAREGSPFQWRTGAGVSYRRYRELELRSPETPFLFAEGPSLRYDVGAEGALVRVPERCFDVRASANGTIGKLLREGAPFFTRVRGGIDARWLPKASDDLAVELTLRAGTTMGAAPLDELFLVGTERDTDLWLRRHRGPRDGKKGSAHLGRRFLLANHDLTKIVVEKPRFSIAVGPFADFGVVSDEPEGLGSEGFVVDVGLKLELRVTAGSVLVLSYGRDLREGDHVFYASYAP